MAKSAALCLSNPGIIDNVEVPEPIPESLIASEQLIDQSRRITLRQQGGLRYGDPSGVFRRRESPDPAPDMPGLAEIPEIFAVMGNQDAIEIRCGHQLLGVGRIKFAEVLRRENFVPSHPKEKPKVGMDIGIQVHLGHVRYRRAP
jgi:hypothetical protein